MDVNGDGGVVKYTLRAAFEGAESPSKELYVCVVHYVGTLEDGTQFDSSRDDGLPFTVELGKHRVIKAWEAVLPTMKVGELCRIKCTSAYGYGDAGSPPDIPGGASLIFEMELMAVRSMLKGPDVDTTAADDLKRLEELRIQREESSLSGLSAREEAIKRKEDAKAAAAARLANKGQKKGGGKGKGKK